MIGVERLIGHGLVVPGIGIGISIGAHLNPWQFLLVDFGLSVALELVLLKSLSALIVGGKTFVPTIALLPLMTYLPRPTLISAIAAAVIVASVIAGVVVYAVRQIRRVGYHQPGAGWRRPMYSAAALFAAMLIELFAAGHALLIAPFGLFNFTLIAMAVPLWWAAYTLQNSPHRGGSRAWTFPTHHIDGGSPTAVLTRARDKSPHVAIVGGVRP